MIEFIGLDDFAALLDRYLAGEASIEELAAEFETLTYKLQNLGPSKEKMLAGLVNEIETVRFTSLEDEMPAAVRIIFSRLPGIIGGRSL